MAATLGHVNVNLLAQVADGEPANVGTIAVPLVASTFQPFGLGEITVDQASMRDLMATALEDAARRLREGRA